MYNIKVYTVNPFSSVALTPGTGTMTFKKTLSPNKISSAISFSNEINIGYGNFNFTYNSDSVDDVINGDVIKLYKGGSVIYFGKVTNKKVRLDLGGIVQYIECKGFQTILNDFYYQDAGNYSFTKTDDPKNIITDILGQSDVELTYFSTDYSNMSLVGSSVSIAFDDDTLMNALKKVLDTTVYYYALRPDGKVYFATLPVTSTHNFTFENEIRNIEIEYNSDNQVNYFTLDYDGGSTFGEDNTSEFAYGSKQYRLTDTNIKNSATATAYISTLIANKKNPIDTIRVDINNNYDTTTIYPGQMMSISNCPITIKNKIIRRVEYTDQGTSIYLNDKPTIEKALSTLIQ